jgi:hypothetical protein
MGLHVPRGPAEREDDGEIVVRAVVHARLLGLRILSLDARVLVVRPPAPLPAFDATTDGRPMPMSEPAPTRGTSPQPLHRGGTSNAGLSRALELLTDGTETLERSRRLPTGTTRTTPAAQ